VNIGWPPILGIIASVALGDLRPDATSIADLRCAVSRGRAIHRFGAWQKVRTPGTGVRRDRDRMKVDLQPSLPIQIQSGAYFAVLALDLKGNNGSLVLFQKRRDYLNGKRFKAFLCIG
jgi:hypothetical protein